MEKKIKINSERLGIYGNGILLKKSSGPMFGNIVSVSGVDLIVRLRKDEYEEV